MTTPKKTPEPEELETETTPEIREEMEAAGARFYESVSFDQPVDWRKHSATDDEDEEE